jgi:hypothetical protein
VLLGPSPDFHVYLKTSHNPPSEIVRADEGSPATLYFEMNGG